MIKLINALGAIKILQPSIAWTNIPFGITRPSVRLYGDGSVPVGKKSIEPRQFSLSGSIFYPDKQQVQNEMDSILAFLQYPPIQCYRNGASERFLFGHPTAINYDQLDGGAEIAINIQMLATDPYWYGIEKEVVGTSAIIAINEGNADSYPLVQIKANGAGDANIANHNGDNITIINLVTNDVVLVDCAKMFVQVNGVNALNRINDSWLLNSFKLNPGNNNINIAGQCSAKIIYRPRWY